MSNHPLLSVAASYQEDRKLKFVRKFMRMAQSVAKSNDSCYSRQIGCIIADCDYRIISMGYNGPPSNTPHCDTKEYLENFFVPQLSFKEKETLDLYDVYEPTRINKEKDWCQKNNKCGTCPRRLINAGPGERSTLCSCQHAERNAVTNATRDLRSSAIYCWCGVPCIDCAGSIINSRLKECHILYVDGPDYHPTSRWLLKQGGVELFEYSSEYFKQ